MEIFEGTKYHNFVGDPFMEYMHNRPKRVNACGYAATGDDATVDESAKPDAKPNSVVNLQPWRYARTALMLIGLYIVGKFIYEKLKKK